MKKSRTTEEKVSYWRTHVEGHRNSGLTQREYCRQQGISYWSFNPWKRKLEADRDKIQEIPKEIVQSLHSKAKQIELILEDRIKISIPDGFSEETLGNVLRIFGVVK